MLWISTICSCTALVSILVIIKVTHSQLIRVLKPRVISFWWLSHVAPVIVLAFKNCYAHYSEEDHKEKQECDYICEELQWLQEGANQPSQTWNGPDAP